MAFCRRCGDIVAGVRCKCGGTAVAPVVPWKQSALDHESQDRWSKTYVQRPKSLSPPATGPPHPPPASTKRFPRPSTLPNTHPSRVGVRSERPPSPLRPTTTPVAPASDILLSLDPNDTTLSKVYGSVLQRPETLETHSCAICSSPFPPDATIYPDPAAPTTFRYLCRPCFEINGGSKGTCPTCSRPVLTLKSEGGFIHASGSYWHKRCFNCAACRKNIGDAPMIDFFGRPSCSDCFDNCLKREPITPKKIPSASISPHIDKSRNSTAVGSAGRAQQNKEGSPAIVEELQQRLGIVKQREGSPALIQRLSLAGQESASRASISARYHDGEASAFTNQREESSTPLYASVREARSLDSRSPPAPASRSSNQVRSQTTGSPAPTQNAIEEMKQRFMRGSSQSPHPNSSSRNSPMIRGTPPLHVSRSSTSLRASPKIFVPQSSGEPIFPRSPSTPDLMSDFSDSMTQSSFSDSPPTKDGSVGDIFRISNRHYYSPHCIKGDYCDGEAAVVEETASQMGTPTRSPVLNTNTPVSTPSRVETSPLSYIPPSAQPFSKQHTKSSPPSLCTSCKGNLFSIREGGKFITVPPTTAHSSPMTYHVHCFKCVICSGLFDEASSGHAVFVRANGGACHVQCAPVEKIVIKTTPRLVATSRDSFPPSTSSSAPSRPSPQSSYKSSSRLDRPSRPAGPSTSTAYRRFGSTTSCPGCKKAVSPMEHGVVPGPQGTRWHAPCLVCGGKKVVSGAGIWKGREEKVKGEAGCGKRLDSAAKSTGDGSVWCRECLLLLGTGGSPQRGPLAPSHTGSANTQVPPQLTGTTTLARHFTGLGGNSEPGLLRQLTGGGLSPTRSISPTKQLGGCGGLRPRPKSVIGMRGNKHVDEGRGMFLVRQLTGAGG